MRYEPHTTDDQVAAGAGPRRPGGLPPPRPRAAVAAPAREPRHASRHFYWRAGRRTRRSTWPKLTVVLETSSHLWLSAVVSRGPGHDAGQFREAAGAAAGRCPL